MGTLGGQGCPSELYRFRGGGDSGENQTVAEVLDSIKAIWRQFGHNAVSWQGIEEEHLTVPPLTEHVQSRRRAARVKFLLQKATEPDFPKMSPSANRTALGIEPEGWRPALTGLHRRRRARRPTQSDATSNYPPQLEPRECCGINSKWQTTTPSISKPAPRSIN